MNLPLNPGLAFNKALCFNTEVLKLYPILVKQDCIYQDYPISTGYELEKYSKIIYTGLYRKYPTK